MKLQKSFEYELLVSTIKYQRQNEGMLEGTKLLMMAPSNKQLSLCIKLKQFFLQAARKAGDSKAETTSTPSNSTEDSKIDGEAIMLMLTMSDINVGELIDCFKQLLFSGICFVDGKEPFVAFHYEQMDMRDTEILLGEYIKHFLLPSQMK